MKTYKISYLFVVITVVVQSCSNNEGYQSDMQNGDLDQTFSISDTDLPIDTTSVLADTGSHREVIVWNEETISNGVMPSCYNFKPLKSSIDNKLEVSVGSGTDVAIKVMDQRTEKCIRYVFINSGSTYSIRNIPEGVYYLKIAYGKKWVSRVVDGRCEGKFQSNPLYEKGLDLLDFNIVDFGDSYSIPSYRLQLDVISSSVTNSFTSTNISETDFNN